MRTNLTAQIPTGSALGVTFVVFGPRIIGPIFRTKSVNGPPNSITRAEEFQ